ncbi:MAG TPA: zf-HC2 domain-containing protein [Gemmatimonadaceae bacterium]|nr:zf-HC2 domain-containing protein [Gemmatimonadaceae bacterium]
MTECINTEVREALPDLLNGRLSALDTATMNAHVEACAECRAELELLREIRASRIVPRMDAARIASAIAPYAGASVVTPQHAGRSMISRFGVLRIAAAAVFVAAGGWALSTSHYWPDSRAVVGEPVVAASPPAATAAASEPAVSVVTTQPAAPRASAGTEVASLSLVGGTDDLSDADLETLVSDIETIDAMPAAEPQSVTVTVDDMGIDQ